MARGIEALGVDPMGDAAVNGEAGMLAGSLALRLFSALTMREMLKALRGAGFARSVGTKQPDQSLCSLEGICDSRAARARGERDRNILSDLRFERFHRNESR